MAGLITLGCDEDVITKQLPQMRGPKARLEDASASTDYKKFALRLRQFDKLRSVAME